MAKDPFLTGKAGRIDLIDVPPMTYFAVEGQGAPGCAAYGGAIEALYTVAYGARFQGKAQGFEEKVGPLQGQWWADDMSAYIDDRRDEWRWNLMIRAPSWMTEAALAGLVARGLQKRSDKPETVRSLAKLALFPLHEGLCLQALHIGPYADEGPLIARMHTEEMPARGLAPSGKHHEIYLSDARRVAPEKLKTLLRQSVRKV